MENRGQIEERRLGNHIGKTCYKTLGKLEENFGKITKIEGKPEKCVRQLLENLT